MRRAIAIAFLALLFVLVALPAIIVKGCQYSDTAAWPSVTQEPAVRLLVHTTGRLVTLPLEEYVAGVVAAEMPTSFEPEALKAQAVIARTFAVRNLRALGGQGVAGRTDADLTTDIWAGGQAWLSQDDARTQWGALGFYGRWQKVEAAVTGTAGLVVTASGVPIQAAYHSTCGGATENSEDVWQEALPYLRGVTDPWCADSPWTRRETDVAVADLAKAFGLDAGVLTTAAGKGHAYVEVVEKTPTGRARRLRVGEKEMTVSAFRRATGLPSARLSFTVSGGVLHFVTVGYGHGVGLCQYGANGMAKAGKDYRAILLFYFAGTEVEAFRAGS